MPRRKRFFKLSKKQIIGLLKETFAEWLNDNAMTLSAALSYYFLFSMAPLIIIVIAVAGFFLKANVVKAEILNRMTDYLDYENARYILSMAESYLSPKTGILATIIAVIIMLVGATSVFVMLKQALNKIWKVKEFSLSLKLLVEERLNYLLVILGVGIWFIFSILLSTLWSLSGKVLQQFILIPDPLLSLAHFLFGVLFLSVLFAMIFKFLPDKRISWSDVWAGSVVSAFFFAIGRYLVGFYLSETTISSAYGAAGSLVAILLWVYYSSLIFLFGAEFTQVYAKRYGSRIGR